MTLNINGKTYEAGELIAYVDKLEKENAELKKDNEGYEKDNTRLVQQYNDLQKENAELKEQNIKDCENFNKTMKETKEQWNKEHYQLTKAKELLKRFIGLDVLEGYDIVEEAEQFLSEVEK